MNLTRLALRNRVFVLAVMAVALVYGVATFFGMSRREDPEITIRAAVVVTRWPGATAEKIEELVTDPLEKAIDQIDEVDKITSKSRTGLSIITVELDERLTEIDQYWDEVRTKLAKVEASLPGGCGRPHLDSDFGDVASVVYALVQVPPPGRSTLGREYSWRDLEDAIARAGSQRMRPILLTTLTTVGGLLPLALFGGPMWAGMSWAMIAGLSLSTVLTLLVVPTVYATFVRVLRMRVV